MTWLESALALLRGPPPARMMSQQEDRAGEIVLAVYEELRAIASGYLQRERANHTLQTTALVNEAYLRLAKREAIVAGNKQEFLSVAAQAVRRILVDHARRKGAQKRASKREDLDLELAPAVGDGDGEALLALDEALVKLSTLHERQARIVELRFFAGLEMDEVARIVGVSPRTAAADWVMARTWLHAELSRGEQP